MTDRTAAVAALLAQSRPIVMGILNVTPDSFSDGGEYLALDAARAAALALRADGADIIDIGGESTRPGAADVTTEDELARVLPVVEALADLPGVVLSIDTSKPEVMRRTVAAGVSLVNDVRALAAPGAVHTAAQLGVPVCLMHMRGAPRTMQVAPRYTDVVGEVRSFLSARMAACAGAGIAREQLILDPGFGFGKRLEHNLDLVRGLGELAELGCPLLAGVSRKSMLGQITGRGVTQRVVGSAILAAACVAHGARIVRVHDVAATWDALRVQAAVAGETWWNGERNGET